MPNESFKLPAGATDCHVHIYGPYSRFPAVHEGKFAPRQESPVEALLALWDGLGIARGVIVHALAAGGDNEPTLDALQRHGRGTKGDRLRGVALLKPDVSERRLDQLTDAGFRGVRINLLRQDGKPVSPGGMGLDDLMALAPRLSSRGWHVQLWIETGDLAAMAADLEKLPFDFVVDHMGRTMADKWVPGGVAPPGFRAFCDRLRGSGRWWCKLSGADRNTRRGTSAGAAYADIDPFMQALVTANPDRLVWGSDWPHVGHAAADVPAEEDLLRLFFRCVPDEAVRRKILVENPRVLYGF